MGTTENIYDIWTFIYDDPNYSLELYKYANGFYLNKKTNEMYSFEQGIKHIIGKKDEDSIYSMWWLENS